MNSLQKILFLILAGVGFFAGANPALHAQEGRERNERVVAGLPLSERENIRKMALMRPGTLEKIARTMSAKGLREEARAIYDLGPHALGTRPLDENGRAQIGRASCRERV